MVAANNLGDLSDTAAARSNLGLGSMATENAASYLAAANNLSDVGSAATARSNLGLGWQATVNGLVKGNGSGTISAATAGTDYLAPAGSGSALTLVSGALTMGTEMSRFLAEFPIPCTSTTWTSATISGTGTVNVNNQNFGHVMSVQTSSNAIFVRQYAALGTSYNYLPGSIGVVDFTKAWRLRIKANFYINGASGKFTLQLGGLNAAPTGHALGAKGFSFTVLSSSAQTGTYMVSVHNGTSQTDSATTTGVLTGTLQCLELTWVPATGFYLSRGGTVLTSVTTGLPASTVNGAGWALLFEQPSSSYSSQINVYPMMLATP